MDYNENNPMSFSTRAEAASYDTGLRAYLLSVYNYMGSALALTGISAWLASHWAPLFAALYQVKGSHLGFTGLGLLVAFAPIIFVMLLSFGVNKLTLPSAQALFWTYSAVMGLSLSSLFFIYTGQSIVRVFFITSILFGSISMLGYTTKRDLTGMGHFMMMGLFGIIIAFVINMFMGSTALQFAVSIMGIVIFTGLTAYDTQNLKAIYYQTSGNAVAIGKSAIMGALTLYLDFINLFIMLLRFFGDRRN